MTHQSTLPPAGAEVEGGFFAGVIQIDGQQHGIVVSPKTAGELTGTWGEYGKKIPAGHPADGLSNTRIMAEHGNNVARVALALDINGHQDWYIPARDELELIYRNLKPTTGENYCSYRDGDNPSSVPPGLMYEDEIPSQTPVKDFQEGGEQAMAPEWYWSSTQFSALHAFFQDVSDGSQSDIHKVTEYRVRAVRRFLIHSSL